MNHRFPDSTPAIRRFACAALLSAMLCQLSACGFIVFNDPGTESVPETTSPVLAESTPSETSAPETDVTSPESEPKTFGELARERLAQLPDRDFDGAPVIVPTVDAVTICPIDADNDVVTAARADTRRAVEEKFNTTIIASLTDVSEMMSAAKEAINSGMYYAELMAIPQSMVGSFRAAGLLGNMYTLPYLNLDAEYYHTDIIESAHAGEALYAVSGAANFNPAYLSCVYFNRTLAEKCGFDLYTLVREGKWTWDKLREFSRNAEGNLNGIAGLGSYVQKTELVDLAAFAHNISYTTSPKNAVPTVDYLDQSSVAVRAKSVVDTMYAIFYTDNAFLANQGNAVRTAFSEETLLFSVDTLDYMMQIADSKITWGILPLPKYDASQSGYVSGLSADAPVFCTPSNLTGVESPGLILEGLNLVSYGYIDEVYMNERINYTLRDSASIGMLDLICEGITTDFAHMFASGFNNLANATYKAVYNSVTTRSTLDALYKSYQSTANRELAASIKLSKYE